MKEQQLSSGKHKAQWRSTMQAYVFPAIGKRPVGEVTAAEVIALGPRQREKSEDEEQHDLIFWTGELRKERCLQSRVHDWPIANQPNPMSIPAVVD